jgi:hypothetical protein
LPSAVFGPQLRVELAQWIMLQKARSSWKP